MLPLALKKKVFEDYGGICAHCGRKLYAGGNSTVDHVIPLSKGGITEPDNLALLCFACNKEKQDDVVEPDAYYRYASKKQKAAMNRLFQEYLKREDWLTRNNVFHADRFTVKASAIVDNGPFKAAGILPTKLDVCKAVPKEVIAYLGEFREQLAPPLRALVYTEESQIEEPFYWVKNRGKVVFLFSTRLEEDEIDGVDIPSIVLDIFLRPGLREKPGVTVPTLYSFLFYLVQEVSKGLEYNNTRGQMRVDIRFPATDKLGEKVLATFREQLDYCTAATAWKAVGQNGQEYHTKRGVELLFYAGDGKTFRQEVKERGYADGRELIKYYDTEGKDENGIRVRLEKNKARKVYNRPNM